MKQKYHTPFPEDIDFAKRAMLAAGGILAVSTGLAYFLGRNPIAPTMDSPFADKPAEPKKAEPKKPKKQPKEEAKLTYPDLPSRPYLHPLGDWTYYEQEGQRSIGYPVSFRQKFEFPENKVSTTDWKELRIMKAWVKYPKVSISYLSELTIEDSVPGKPKGTVRIVDTAKSKTSDYAYDDFSALGDVFRKHGIRIEPERFSYTGAALIDKSYKMSACALAENDAKRKAESKK